MYKETIVRDGEREAFIRIINESYLSKLQIIITIFGEFENIDYVGVVESFDPLKNEIKLNNVRMLIKQMVAVKYCNKNVKRIL